MIFFLQSQNKKNDKIITNYLSVRRRNEKEKKNIFHNNIFAPKSLPNLRRLT